MPSSLTAMACESVLKNQAVANCVCMAAIAAGVRHRAKAPMALSEHHRLRAGIADNLPCNLAGSQGNVDRGVADRANLLRHDAAQLQMIGA